MIRERARYVVRQRIIGKLRGRQYDQCGHKHYSLNVAERCRDRLNKESQVKTWVIVQFGGKG